MPSEGRAFHPVEGDTGDKAAAAFTRRAADGVYLAVFNYDEKQPRTISVPLSRIDQQLAAAPSIAVTDVATREALAPARGAVTVELSPAESKLLKLSQQP